MRDAIEPPVTVTSVAMKSAEASDNVKVIVSVSPDLSVAEPLREIVTEGTVVSVVRFRIELHDELSLPATSATAFGPIQSDAFPLATFAVGVNVAVYVDPEPPRFESEPVEALEGHRTTSSRVNPVTDSENVKVIVSVWPALIVPVPALVIEETVGSTPSTLCVA